MSVDVTTTKYTYLISYWTYEPLGADADPFLRPAVGIYGLLAWPARVSEPPTLTFFLPVTMDLRENYQTLMKFS